LTDIRIITDIHFQTQARKQEMKWGGAFCKNVEKCFFCKKVENFGGGVVNLAGYLSKVADFDPPHLHLAPP